MSEETQNPQDAPNIPEEAPETATAAPEAFVEIPASPETPDPAGQLRVLAEKLAASEDNWLRAKAETENVRRRAQEDVAKAHKFAIEKFAGELLAVKDSLEAALSREGQSVEDLRGGVELTLKQLVAAFEKSGIKEIDPLGERFDPNLHQAIQMVESDLEPNAVAQVLQKGYLIAERVLRPAMVMVSRGKA